MASIQDRIAALRQGVREKKECATDEAGVGAAQSARPIAARARRFGLSASVGITDEADGGQDSPSGDAGGTPSAVRPRGTRLVIEAQALHAEQQDSPPPTPTPAAAEDTGMDSPAQPMEDPGEWPCETTPAGSAFSDDQWTRTEQDNPDCTVFEMIKPGERALVLVPAMQPTMASLFRRSLVVDLRASHLAPWASRLASASLEHASVAFGVVRYAIIRAASERERTAWLDGSVLRTADPGADMPPEQGKSSPARTSRFTTAPRSSPAAVAQRGAPGPEPQPRSRQFAAALERMR